MELTNTKSMHDATFGIIPVKKMDGKNLFLLVKSRSGTWGFPKGHPEKGESDTETATRELAEETGIKKVHLFTKYSFPETRIHIEADHTITKTIVWFIGMVHKNEKVEIKDKNEIIEYKWLRFDEAYSQLSHDETKRVFLDARIYLNRLETGELSELSGELHQSFVV